MLGTITFFNNPRAYGFISTPEGESIFFHLSNFEQGSQPVLGALVAFEIGPPISIGKKPQAVFVRYPKRIMDATAGELADKAGVAALAHAEKSPAPTDGGGQ